MESHSCELNQKVFILKSIIYYRLYLLSEHRFFMYKKIFEKLMGRETCGIK